MTHMRTKLYEFKVSVLEGNDEFWEGLENKNGCDDVYALVRDALEGVGLFHGENCKIVLSNFTSNGEL